MHAFDLTPLLRSSVGFDRFSDLFDAALTSADKAPTYPPYNIEKHDDDHYRIVMAVAGFGDTDLDIVSQSNVLTVSGRIGDAVDEGEQKEYLYRGIANRTFERKFSLADHVKVTGAALKDGLLHVDLVREIPETDKPRAIAIQTDGKATKRLSSKKLS